MWRTALLAAVAVASGACGHGLTPDGLAAAEQDARCTHLVKCGLFTDHAACMAFFPVRDDPSPGAAVKAHRARFDEAAASACISALATASCDASAKDTRTTPAVCGKVLVGLGDSGAPCAASDECASGNCVVATSCGSACCTGTCGDPVTLPGPGQTCTGACAGDAVCNDNGLCVALAPPGGTCQESPECAYGYGCTGTISSPSGMGTCTPLPANGESCKDGDCGDFGAVCNTQLVCAAAGLTGDPCTSPNDCSAFYQCDSTGHCNPYPTRGMPCMSLCSDGTWCDKSGGTPGTCAAPKPSGMPCVANVECETRFCDTSGGPGTGTCAPVPVCI